MVDVVASKGIAADAVVDFDGDAKRRKFLPFLNRHSMSGTSKGDRTSFDTAKKSSNYGERVMKGTLVKSSQCVKRLSDRASTGVEVFNLMQSYLTEG